MDLDEPITYEDLPGVADGDFPPMPGSLTGLWLPASIINGAGGVAVERVETTFSGSYLHVGQDQEAVLVAALEAFGHTARRDDDLVNRLGWWD